MDTAIFQAPKWIFQLTVGRLLTSKASDDVAEVTAEKEESDEDMGFGLFD